MRAIVTTALAALAPLALAAGPFDGLYRPNYDWAKSWDCKTVGMDGGALEIRGDRLSGVENTCTLTDPVEVRDMAAVLYDESCVGEGTTGATGRVMIMRHDFGVYVITDGLVLDWLRCK